MKLAVTGLVILLAAIAVAILSVRGEEPSPPAAPAAPPVDAGPWHAMFWNIENMFDTVDDPRSKSEDALEPPVFEEKLRRIREVVRRVDFGRGPDILALVEVETPEVVRQIVGQVPGPRYEVFLKPCGYERGINVALATRLPVAAGTAVEHLDPGTTGRTILHAVLQTGPEPLHVFVFHLKSQRNLEREPEVDAANRALRVKEAKFLRGRVDAILAKDAAANILLLGDYNEDCDDSMFRDVLQAVEARRGDKAPTYTTGDEVRLLVNYGPALKQSFPRGGTCCYYRKWSVFDNVLTSEALALPGGLWLTPYKVWIGVTWDQLDNFAEPEHFDLKYPTGVSDHLPVIMRLTCGS